jgi:hypothetical protein
MINKKRPERQRELSDNVDTERKREMETDIQSIFLAQVVTQEKLREKKHETVKLEHGRDGGFAQLLQDLFRSFR